MKLISMSIAAGSLILCILPVRIFAVRFLPKRLFVCLWMVVLLRLLVPVHIPVNFGGFFPAAAVQNRITGGEGGSGREESAHGTAEEQAGNAGGQEGRGTDAAGEGGGRADRPESEGRAQSGPGKAGTDVPVKIAYLLWAFGTAGLLCHFGSAFWKEHRVLSECLPLSSREEERFRSAGGGLTGGSHGLLWISDRIASPLAFGVLHPRIVLPKHMAEEIGRQGNYAEFSGVLLHEWIHIRRKDNVRKLLALFAVCLHWWNPAVWVMYLFLNRDLELACDEAVLRVLGEERRAAYAGTLLALAKWQSGQMLAGSAFGRKAVRERIVMIMTYKKTGIAGIVCAVLLLLLSVSVFAETVEKKAESNQAEGVHFYQFAEYVGKRLVYERRHNRLLYEEHPVGFFWDRVKGGGLYKGYLAAREAEDAVAIFVERDAQGNFLRFQQVPMEGAADYEAELEEEAKESGAGEEGTEGRGTKEEADRGTSRVYDMQTLLNQVKNGTSPKEICSALLDEKAGSLKYSIIAERSRRGEAVPGTLYVRIITKAGWGEEEKNRELLIKIGNEVMRRCWELREVCFVYDGCRDPENSLSERNYFLRSCSPRTRGISKGQSLVMR